MRSRDPAGSDPHPGQSGPLYYFKGSEGTMKFEFSRAQGLEEAKSFLTQALASGKFPHALLVHGPEGVGQNPLILDLADILFCDSTGMRPCGQCPGCLGRKRNNLDNLIFLMPIEKKDKASASGSGDGEMEDSQVDELTDKARDFHADPYGFARTGKGQPQRRPDPQPAGAALVRRGLPASPHRGHPLGRDHGRLGRQHPAQDPGRTASQHLLPFVQRRSQRPFAHHPVALHPVVPVPHGVRKPCARPSRPRPGDWDMQAAPERLIPFAEGSPGVLLGLHRYRRRSPDRRDRGASWPRPSARDWMGFSEYLEESDAFADLQAASRLLHFLLRTLRLFHRLSALEGPVRNEPDLPPTDSPGRAKP